MWKEDWRVDPAAPRPAGNLFFRRLGTFLLLVILAGAAGAGAVLLERELKPTPPPAADPELVRQLEARLAILIWANEGLEKRVTGLEQAPPPAAAPVYVPGDEGWHRARLEIQLLLLKAMMEGLAGNRERATRALQPVEEALERAAGLPGRSAAWAEELGELAGQVARARLELAAGRLSALDRLELVWHQLLRD